MKLLAYHLIIYDNKCSMFRNIELHERDTYSDIYTINRIDPAVRVRSKRPFSSTYDNFTIVTEQLKQFCELERYTGLEFMPLPKSPGFYWLKIHNIIACDVDGYGASFINYSERYDGYEEIIGATPVYLKDKEVIQDGFYRTDMCFGSFAAKSPVEIIGIDTKTKLKAAGFKGVDYEEIYDRYM